MLFNDASAVVANDEQSAAANDVWVVASHDDAVTEVFEM
jgi:hypothetical protein